MASTLTYVFRHVSVPRAVTIADRVLFPHPERQLHPTLTDRPATVANTFYPLAG
jgi:hypothetical protein